MERVEAIKRLALWSLLVTAVAALWRVRVAFLLILPAAYQVIYWPDLLERQAGAVLMAVIPVWYMLDSVIRTLRSRKKQTTKERAKKVRAAQKAARV